MNKSYSSSLQEMLVECAVRASRRRQNVRIGVATGIAALGYNRRDRENGFVSHDVKTLLLTDESSEKPVFAVTNYACHPVVLGSENLHISADYPGYFREAVTGLVKAPAMFLNGACGDIDPLDANKPGLHRAKKMGDKLGAAVHKSLPRTEWLHQPCIGNAWTTVELPVNVTRSARELERRFVEMNARFHLPGSMFDSELQRRKMDLADGRFPRAITIRMQLISLGHDIALLFVPGEVFSELGESMKSGSPFRHTLVCGFANGTVGYLPTRNAYLAGGYEPHFAHFFYGYPELSPSIEDALIAGANRLFSQASRS